MIAGVVAAERTGVGIGDVAAHGAVSDLILDAAQGVGETLGLLARVLEDVEREALRALRPDAGQMLQLLDQSDQRLGQRQAQNFIPGGSMPPIFCAISSSAFRCASLIAATIRSCNISTSSFDTTSGSIFSDSNCLVPLIVTVTMPPPAVASTRNSAICFCICSCICLACCIMAWMFIRSPRRS